LNYLPGGWRISIAIEPPISNGDLEDLAESLPFGLPNSLRRLYTEAAAKFCCAYTWTPDAETLAQFQSVFPHESDLYGGVRFIPCTELLEAHGIHTWLEGIDDQPTKAQQLARGKWQHTIPFISVGNGDYLALHFRENRKSMPVVYLSHDDPERPVKKLSPSFDQFLQDWERLCYVGPDIWTLNVFLSNRGQRQLGVRQKNVQRLRSLLLGRRRFKSKSC
jgi:SMI1 / KNR4 family (SUKH-1)